MLTRRTVLSVAATLAALSLTSATHAADSKPFDQKAFEAAQAAGKPILVEVYAPWCPTCRAQAPILTKLGGSAKFKDVVRFKVDFDGQKDVLKTFKVNVQSTLIAFKGKKEVGRSSGDTNAASIEALFAKAI
ncbi:MAG: thioredoxin family protein [Pseudolabrys sp.]